MSLFLMYTLTLKKMKHPLSVMYSDQSSHLCATGRIFTISMIFSNQDVSRMAAPIKILAAHGLTENNPYEWCRKTHGVMYNDFWWIKFPGETIKWDDVKVR